MNPRCIVPWALILAVVELVFAPEWVVLAAADPRASVGDEPLAQYFQAETVRLENACRSSLSSVTDWQTRAPECRRQLFDMLGLDPLPARTDLRVTVTGRIEQPDFTVEKLHFQSLPGLYVTANFYLPRNLAKPAPAVLYVCGHAQVKTNGVSCGNKTAYQHHGIWFARNGYACLIIDTVQLGEIEGLHHGTYREGMWWWNSRGYTPAGVEAWNGIRALDYLESRSEVDRTRLGMTGRSGGGSYTWTVAALDERVRAAAPVAGITDLHNQVVDGCVEGHCDCMFFVNTYRWDFPQVAALVAPRPLLIVNTDDDSIFPLDGVVRLHAQVRDLYAAQGKPANLGLVIGPGGHNDTQDLQVPVMRWFNYHLKGEDPLIENAAKWLFDARMLRVFDELPADQINTRIHEVWGTQPAGGVTAEVLERLRKRSFGGWPDAPDAVQTRLVFEQLRAGLRLRVWDFESQPHVPLRLFAAEPGGSNVTRVEVEVLDETAWRHWQRALAECFGSDWAPAVTNAEPPSGVSVTTEEFEALVASVKQERVRRTWFAPRGIGPGDWSIDSRKQIQIRRRFMLLGQTLDGMRVWDIRRGAQVARGSVGGEGLPVKLTASGGMGVNAVYATLFEPAVRHLGLSEFPASPKNGPDYLNAWRYLDVPGALDFVRKRGVEIVLDAGQSKIRP